MKRPWILLTLLALAMAFTFALVIASLPREETSPNFHDGRLHGNPIEDTFNCLMRKSRTALVVAPIQTGLVQKVEIPPEMRSRCYLFSAAYNPCTGLLIYADAITEIGPKDCPPGKDQP